jgi:hypothetical protein
MTSKKLTLVLFLILLSACATDFQAQVQAKQVSSHFLNEICRVSLKTNLWNEIYKLAEEQKGFPSESTLARFLRPDLETQQDPLSLDNQSTQKAIDDFVVQVTTAYVQVIRQIQAEVSVGDPAPVSRQMVRALAELELGDASTPDRLLLQTQLRGEWARAQTDLDKLNLKCKDHSLSHEAIEAESPSPLLRSWRKSQPLALYGAWKTMATAYQSCDVVSRPVLSTATPEAQGVAWYSEPKVTPSSGKWRYFSDKAAFLNSNPYYKKNTVTNSKCLDVRQSPLVYDFGGKPFYASVFDTSLDLFKDAGSGSPDVLGVDCSGFIVTAYLSAGLKFSSQAPSRAVFVDTIGAHALEAPQEHGLDCLRPIVATSQNVLKPGDILSVGTHVVMIDQVGSDPFGIGQIKKKERCVLGSAIGAIDYHHFDFTIIQSSPTKGSLGIDRVQIASYLPEEPVMIQALEKYALAACYAKFDGEFTPHISEGTISRHLNQSQCFTNEFSLQHQSCLDECSADQPAN